MSWALPSRTEEVLLWAWLVFLWMAVNYLHRLDPLGSDACRALEAPSLRKWRWGVLARSVAGAGAVLWISGGHPSGLLLAGLFLTVALSLPLVRMKWARSRGGPPYREMRAEWELACNAVFLAASALLIGSRSFAPTSFFQRLPMGHGRLAVLLIVASSLVFLIRGGTHVVRGVLEKSDTLPPQDGDRRADAVRHGATIGNLERLLVLVFGLVAQYGALGFVLAAKGLVRAAEWKDRESVEYFLVGTLASTGLALVIGLAVRALAAAWW